MDQQVVVFLTNGKTLVFYDVFNFCIREEYIEFDYFVENAEREHSGIFYFEKIAGWSASIDLLED